MKEQIADICRKVNDSIRNFRVDPINSLEYLIPIVIFLIGIINGVVTQYAFAHNGGYGAQMDAIKTYGVFDGYSEKFTTGTTGLIVHGFFGRVIFILVRVRYLVFKKDENAVEKRKKPDIHYLYEIQEGESSPQKSTITKFLKNIEAFLILQTYHPENQKEVLLDRRRLLGWYGRDDQKNDTSIWYLDHFLWHGENIFWRNDTRINLNFIKFGVNPEYLKHFDFKLIEPKSEDELKTYIKEYGDRYWILKDTGHVKNSPLCFVNNTIE